jgi:hypothetical protein
MAKRGKTARRPPAARKAPSPCKRAPADIDLKKQNATLKRELAEALERQSSATSGPDHRCVSRSQRPNRAAGRASQADQGSGHARIGRGAGPDGKGLRVEGGEIKGINLSGRIDVAIGGRFPQRASETRSSRLDKKPLSAATRMHGLFEHGSQPR